MSKKNHSQTQQDSQAVASNRQGLTEDWSAVIIAIALILLAVIGLIGPNLINITF